jgi:hypothetical protein
MNKNKLFAVVGATGHQGGSVLKYLRVQGDYRVRALTHDPNSEKAKSLLKYENVELVEADMMDAESMVRAFKGCQGAFIYTTPDVDEERAGKTMVDAAFKAEVDHVIFSTLPYVYELSNHKIQVPEFDNKGKVELYIKDQLQRNKHTTFSYIQPGFFMQDILWFYKLKIAKDGVIENDPLPLEPTTELPVVNVYDIGQVTLPMFIDHKSYENVLIRAASEYITFPQMMQAVADQLGMQYRYVKCSYEDYKNSYSEEDANMMRWYNEYGYYLGRQDLKPTRAIAPKLMTFREWVRSGIDWMAELRSNSAA